MSVVSFGLAVVFIIRLFSTSAFRVPMSDLVSWESHGVGQSQIAMGLNGTKKIVTCTALILFF